MKRTSVKAQLGRTHCVLMPRPSQKESVEDFKSLSVESWLGASTPSLRRQRNKGAQYQTAFLLYPVSIQPLEKIFNISFNIPQLQSDHLSPLTTDQQPRFPPAPLAEGLACRGSNSKGLWKAAGAAAGGLLNPQF